MKTIQLTISKNNISLETCLIFPPDYTFFLFLYGQLIYGFLSWACKEVNCMFCLYAKSYSSVLLLIQSKKWQSPIWCWTLIYFNVIVYFFHIKAFHRLTVLSPNSKPKFISLYKFQSRSENWLVLTWDFIFSCTQRGNNLDWFCPAGLIINNYLRIIYKVSFTLSMKSMF